MKKHRVLSTIISLSLAFIIVLSLFAPVAVYAYESLDYSRGSFYGYETLPAEKIIEQILGDAVSEEEKRFLEEFSTVSIKYTPKIPSSAITTSENGDTLTVKAKKYSYTAKNGAEVIWLPSVATYNGQALPFLESGEEYIADFEKSSDLDEIYVTVDYIAQVTLSQAHANSLINEAYNRAPQLFEEYTLQMAKYEAQLNAYERYLEDLAQYESDYLLYNDYVEKKKIYDTALSHYNDYLFALEQYEKDSALYASYLIELEEYNEQYKEYAEYLDKKAVYELEYAKYEEYLLNLEKVDHQLFILKSARTWMDTISGPRSFHVSIASNLISSVLENKALITSEFVGVEAQIVDRAGEATDIMRSLLDGYLLVRDGTLEERYSYYCANYEAFKASAYEMLICLDKLYENNRVRAILILEEKKDKYLALLAQLHLFVNLFHDDESALTNFDGDDYYDEEWKIDGKTALQLPCNKVYIEDIDLATPIPTGYPHTAIEKPTQPSEVAEPKKPETVRKPVMPEVVENPGEAPTVVLKPETVSPVEKPENEPILSKNVNDILQKIDNNALTQRDGVQGDITIKLSTSVNKTIGAEEVTVEFYDTDGTPLEVHTVDKNSVTVFEGVIPTKAETDEAIYTFAGWITEANEVYDLSTSLYSAKLYPYFDKQIKSYTVTWDVLGVKTEQKFLYGTVPQYDGAPKKADDGQFIYFFDCFKDESGNPVSTVYGDKTYYAHFNERYLVPLGNSGAIVELSSDAITVDATAMSVKYLEIGHLLKRAENKSLTINSRNMSVSFAASEVDDLRANGAYYIYLCVNATDFDGYQYSVYVYDEDKQPISTEMQYRARVSGVFFSDPASTNYGLYTLAGDEKQYYTYSFIDNGVTFIADILTDYSFQREYEIHAINRDDVRITLDKDYTKAGDKIRVTATPSDGMRILRLYYVHNGTETEIINGEFVMPEGDVTVFAVAEKMKYTIVFKVNDVTILEKEYYLGETPIPPSNPSVGNDSYYSYTFIHWSEEITPVSGNKVYHAVFEAKEAEKTLDTNKGISDSMLRVIIAGGALALILSLALLLLIYKGIVHLIKERMW